MLSLPIFVKPARTGSSVGVSKVKVASALADAVREAQKFDEKVLLEEAIVGQEIECAVLGDARGEVKTSVVGEISPAQEFYTYTAKYDDEGSVLYIPARIPDSAAARVRADAEKVFKVVSRGVPVATQFDPGLYLDFDVSAAFRGRRSSLRRPDRPPRRACPCKVTRWALIRARSASLIPDSAA